MITNTDKQNAIKEFHLSRIAFYVDPSDFNIVVNPCESRSHRDWIPHSEYYSSIRGYYLNKSIHIYQGDEFYIPSFGKSLIHRLFQLFQNAEELKVGCFENPDKLIYNPILTVKKSYFYENYKPN